MIHKILCPVDFSEGSINAAEYANELAFLTGATLILFHKQNLLAVTHGSIMGENLTYSLERIARDKMASLIHLLSRNNDPKNIQSFLSFGLNTEDEIVISIEKHKPDLVVMNTEGTEGLGEILTGTKTESVVKKTPWPVLIIPPGFKFSQGNEIIFTTNYEGYDRINLDFVLQLARVIKSHVTVLHVLKDKNKEPFHSTIPDNLKEEVSFEIIIDNDIIDEVYNYASKKGTGIIVMKHHERSLLEEIFHPSLSIKIINRAEIPLLILK